MASNIEQLVDQYWNWLQDKTDCRQLDTSVEITTPYLDRHNDYLQIYVQSQTDGFVLSDDGYIIEDLEHSGCTLDSPKRRDLLETTLNGFGVRAEGKELKVFATPTNFAMQKHNLVQAMLAINDLFYLTSTKIENFFFEDVALWLDSNKIRYTPSVKLAGKSGYDNRFDFVIPKSEEKPERVVRVVNRPNRSAVQAMVFAWIDTKETRSIDSCAYAILNDKEQNLSVDNIVAMQNYKIKALPWSKPEKIQEELAA